MLIFPQNKNPELEAVVVINIPAQTVQCNVTDNILYFSSTLCRCKTEHWIQQSGCNVVFTNTIIYIFTSWEMDRKPSNYEKLMINYFIFTFRDE